ncbi:MAG: aKG-HExxH-type peptide beta-hydroxylase [Mycobacterium sp.]
MKRLAIELGDFPLSKVDLMPDVLRWEEVSQAGLDAVFDAYVAFVSQALDVAFLSQALGHTLGEYERQESALARNLAAKLQTVPAPDFLRVVLAPEFTHRLLWPHPDRLQRICEFLDKALHAEGVISGREEAADCDVWTALGDMKVLQSGEILRGVNIPGLPPLDLDSPNVTSAVRSEEFAPDQFRLLSNHVRPLVIDRMTIAWNEISATSKLVADFVAKFVQVIVLQNENTSTRHSSGSNGQYIGQVVITNPHSEYAGDIEIAEAIVHEAIHSLLFMALHTVPWGTDHNHTYATGVKIVSPWTGTPLDVEQFLQACFVWYGLLHFWDLALRVKTFKGSDKARSRLAEALRGFVGSPLLDNLDNEDRKILRDDVSNAIETMQSRVKACFG